MLSKSKNDLENLDNVSKRLKYIVDTMGVKQSHMAEKLGLSPSGLHYILNNDVKFSKNAKKIAEYLNINEDWLMKGEGDIHCENTSIKTYKIPTYYPDQLKIYYRSNQREKINTNNFAITTAVYSNQAIGIFVTETNFTPKFEINDVVLFEQVSKFNDGEIILVYLVKSNTIAIKHGFYANNDIILISNDEQPIKLANDNDSTIVIGSYRECFKKSNIF